MREFDASAGRLCEEDVLTQRWLEDAAPYIRVDYEVEKGKGEGSAPAVPAAPLESVNARDPRR